GVRSGGAIMPSEGSAEGTTRRRNRSWADRVCRGRGSFVKGESMAFKKLLASLGAGGASVETVLTEVNVVPGGVVQGEVRIQGGSVNQAIEGLNVGLQARV